MGDKHSGKLNIGGQAVIEGVMIKSQGFYAVAVRKPNKKIIVKAEKVENFFSKRKIFQKPFFRGIAQLVETLVIGIKALSFSANEASGEKEEEKISYTEIAITMAFAFAIAIVLFILLPLFFSNLITKGNGILFNLMDGAIRIAIFLVYLFFISFLKDVKRIFQYHGAEHKTIYCYEKNVPLTVKNVKKFSTLHPRCGTSFIMIVLILSILVFSLIVTDSFLIKFISRLVLIPVIAGIAYEFLKLSAKYEHKKFVKPLIYPGLLVQKMTTKEPDKRQIEVAIHAVKKIISLER